MAQAGQRVCCGNCATVVVSSRQHFWVILCEAIHQVLVTSDPGEDINLLVQSAALEGNRRRRTRHVGS